MTWPIFLLSLACGLCACLATATPPPTALPIIDLGYQFQQATLYNASGNFYNFSNVRYAAPPVGKLRFQEPQPPSDTNKTLENGTQGRICPQASPGWENTAEIFVPAYLTGKPFNATAAQENTKEALRQLPPQDPRTTEDCLFLDIVVPRPIFENRTTDTSNTTVDDSGAPVLVWIHGGGYVFGEKSAHDASGLIKASQDGGSDGVIFVSLNYRLGAFGWLSGPSLQSDGVANAGLYDQRLALHWVQDNIHLFGGNPRKVTVMGESAGGGSILHQITAFAGLKGPAPFQQAILQSPAFQNVVSYLEQEKVYRTYLALLNVSSVAEARTLSYEKLQMANMHQVALNSTYGGFTFGPVVDGLIAPAVPGKLLLQGSYDRDLNLLLGHNADEGLVFVNPYIQSDDDLVAFIKSSFPTIQPTQINYIKDILYPSQMSGTLGSSGYTDTIGRLDLTISESSFTCNNYYLERAYHNKTYGYQFSVPPGLHGQDVPYTFFNGADERISSDSTAYALQKYITAFAQTSIPFGTTLPHFPIFGNDSQIIDLNATKISQITDPVANARCLYWQKELYL